MYIKKIALFVLSIVSASAFASFETQSMRGPANEQVTKSANYNAMSGSGRFAMWGSPLTNNTSQAAIYVRDMKTLTTQKLTSGLINVNFYAISLNGRYAVYVQDNSLWLHDLMNGTTSIVAQNPLRVHMAVSNTGVVAYTDSATQNINIKHPQNAQSVNLGRTGEIKQFDQTGSILLYVSNQETYGKKAYLYYPEYNTHRVVSYTSPNVQSSVPVTGAALSQDGNVVFFAAEQGGTTKIYRHVLSSNVVQEFNPSQQYISFFAQVGDKKLSSSYDGRYLTHSGLTMPGHSDYTNLSVGRDRVFRLDSQSSTYTTMSRTYNDQPLDDFINHGNFTSADGSMVLYSSAADNIENIVNHSAEEPYHVHLKSAFSRKVLFIDLVTSSDAWKSRNPMRLIDDYIWEGTIKVTSTDSFKFDMGGQWNNEVYTATPEAVDVYGDSNADGVADNYGSGILINSGPGTYTVRFNELSKRYDISLLATDAQDFEGHIGWINAGNKPWMTHAGYTPSSGTGPSDTDNGSHYAYMETSSGYAYTAGDQAIMQSNAIVNNSASILFSYHMYGADVGTLYLEAKHPWGTSWTTLWSAAGQQHSSSTSRWSQAYVDLSNQPSSLLIRFRAVARGGWQGDIAVDDIRVLPRPSANITYKNPAPLNQYALGYSKISGTVDFYALADTANQYCREHGFRGFNNWTESAKSSYPHSFFKDGSWQVNAGNYFSINSIECTNSRPSQTYTNPAPQGAAYIGSPYGFYDSASAKQYCQERGFASLQFSSESHSPPPIPYAWWTGSNWNIQTASQQLAHTWGRITALTCYRWE